MASKVVATITHSTEIRTGIWCDECLTGAGVAYDLLLVTDHGISPFGTVKRCLRCDPC